MGSSAGRRPCRLRFLAAVAALASPSTPAIAAQQEPVAPDGAAVVADAVLGAMDRTVQPCIDFYRFACGGWAHRTPMPTGKDTVGRSIPAMVDGTTAWLAASLRPGGALTDARPGVLFRTCMAAAADEAAAPCFLSSFFSLVLHDCMYLQVLHAAALVSRNLSFASSAAFRNRTNCLVDQYSSYTVEQLDDSPPVCVNGAIALSEILVSWRPRRDRRTERGAAVPPGHQNGRGEQPGAGEGVHGRAAVLGSRGANVVYQAKRGQPPAQGGRGPPRPRAIPSAGAGKPVGCVCQCI